jgi:NAD/NADP transhydrogenase beta subunit
MEESMLDRLNLEYPRMIGMLEMATALIGVAFDGDGNVVGLSDRASLPQLARLKNNYFIIHTLASQELILPMNQIFRAAKVPELLETLKHGLGLAKKVHGMIQEAGDGDLSEEEKTMMTATSEDVETLMEATIGAVQALSDFVDKVDAIGKLCREKATQRRKEGLYEDEKLDALLKDLEEKESREEEEN